MKLYNLHIKNVGNQVKLIASVESKKLGEKELWFSTNNEYNEFVSDSTYDAFLVGMIYPAMEYGEDIHIEGGVSGKLLFNINNYVIPLIKSFSPSCKMIKVTSDEISTAVLAGEGVGTGFSGGVDSFCTIYDHYELEENEEYKINSFLFLNVGSHGYNEKSAYDKFQQRYNYLKKFPEEINIKFIPVDSNLHSFHPWGHQKTHTLTSAAGVLFLQKHYKKFYYASAGLDYNQVIENSYKYKNIDIGIYCDSILLPLLGTECTEFIPDGNQYTRVQKTIHILDYEPVKRYLNVCTSTSESHENCSVCSKCCRTIMTIDSVGRLEEFHDIFDISKYRKTAEKKYKKRQVLVKRRDIYASQNVKLAERNGIKMPNRFFCIVEYIINKLKLQIRKIVK